MDYHDTIGRIIEISESDINTSYDEIMMITMLEDIAKDMYNRDNYAEFTECIMEYYNMNSIDVIFILAYMSSITEATVRTVSDVRRTAYDCIKTLCTMGLSVENFTLWASTHLDLSHNPIHSNLSRNMLALKYASNGTGNGFRKTIEYWLHSKSACDQFIDCITYQKMYTEEEDEFCLSHIVGSARIKCTKNKVVNGITTTVNIIEPEYRYLISHIVNGFKNSKDTYEECYHGADNKNNIVNLGYCASAYDYVSTPGHSLEDIIDIITIYDIDYSMVHTDYMNNKELWLSLLSSHKIYTMDTHDKVNDTLSSHIGSIDTFVECTDVVCKDDTINTNDDIDDIETYIDSLIDSIKINKEYTESCNVLDNIILEHEFERICCSVIENNEFYDVDKIVVNDMIPYIKIMLEYNVLDDNKFRKLIIDAIKKQVVSSNTENVMCVLRMSSKYNDLNEAIKSYFIQYCLFSK